MCGCETWLLKDILEQQLRVFVRKVMGKMYSLIKMKMGIGG
jgi:hypothetical protein